MHPGKTTQVPQFLLDAGWTAADQGFRGTRKRLIAITQPRRLAATTLAARVAEERGSVLGEEIGYSVRFEDASHPRLTKVKFLTDGLLFQEAMADPLLSQYSVIMVDEAHERSLYTDILLGVLKKYFSCSALYC